MPSRIGDALQRVRHLHAEHDRDHFLRVRDLAQTMETRLPSEQ